jgi:translation initiation factor IF-1
VLESLINGLFRLQMADGRPVVAHVAKDLRMALSRLLPGDQVLVDVSPYDPGKARICKLLAQ